MCFAIDLHSTKISLRLLGRARPLTGGEGIVYYNGRWTKRVVDHFRHAHFFNMGQVLLAYFVT